MRSSPDQYISQSTKSPWPLIGWLVLAAGAVFVLALIVAAPVALANNHASIALTIYRGFSKVCHQLPERSFFVAGHSFAVCARCTGLYAGFTAALLIYPLLRSLRQTAAPPRKWLFMAAAPMAIDVGFAFLGYWESTHSSRFLTGALLGAAAVFYVMPGMADVVLRGLRATLTSGKRLPPLTATASPDALPAAPSDYSAPHRRI